MGAEIRAQAAREDAQKAIREADRATAEAWSLRMEGYGRPAQPSPTIEQCLNGGLGWLEVECNRCKIRASLSIIETSMELRTSNRNRRARASGTAAIMSGDCHFSAIDVPRLKGANECTLPEGT